MDEITLYDTSGKPCAYIADDDKTIFVWTGEPAAYLDNENIYGFNGKHLDWFEKGVIWNHKGERVGYIKETLPTYAPYKPYKSIHNSGIMLTDFLMLGR